MNRKTLQSTQSRLQTRPPLKWAGGKRWLIERLRGWWLPFADRPLVEPFCGGLSVALGLSPPLALLNDINPHVIHFYAWLKRGLNVSIAMENDEQLYYCHRDRFNASIRAGEEHTAEAAQLFYYLNRTCFNGLCRFNKKGEFNVPFGKYKTIGYATEFSPFVDVLRSWEFSSLDFAALKLEAGAFVYADPPYDVEFTSYAKEGFGWADQVRLMQWLDGHDGPVVVSNQATDRILDLYRKHGYEIELLDAPRRISCTGDRAKAREVLALKGF